MAFVIGRIREVETDFFRLQIPKGGNCNELSKLARHSERAEVFLFIEDRNRGLQKDKDSVYD